MCLLLEQTCSSRSYAFLSAQLIRFSSCRPIVEASSSLATGSLVLFAHTVLCSLAVVPRLAQRLSVLVEASPVQASL